MYTEEHVYLASICQSAYVDKTSWSVSEVDATVIKEDGVTTIILRGTETDLWPFNWSKEGISNWRDVIRDFRFIPMDVGYGKVHKGFYLSACRWMWAFSTDLPVRGISYVISGHSKGAAEATQLAIMMKARGYNIKELVTFAEPNSLTKKSYKHFKGLNIPATSYITKGDPIKFTPPWGKCCVKRTKLKGKYRGHSIGNYINALIAG